MSRWLAVAGSVLAPAVALACAACARDQGHLAWLFIGGLVAAPYAVVALVVHALRQAGVRP